MDRTAILQAITESCGEIGTVRGMLFDLGEENASKKWEAEPSRQQEGVQHLVAAIRELGEEDREAVLKTLWDIDGLAWDQEMRQDAQSGRLAGAVEQADREIAAGNTVPYSPDLFREDQQK